MKIQTIFTKHMRWIDIADPGREEVEWLAGNFKFHPLHLEAVASTQQRPHIDEGKGYDFIVLLFPVYDRAAREIVPGEVDFFIGSNFIITAHYNQINTLKNLFNETRNSAEVRSAYTQKGPGFLLYKILEGLLRRSYPILDHMSEDIAVIERGIFRDTSMDMLSRISLMKKNIIEFRKMIKTHRYVLEKLPKRAADYLDFPQSKIYYRDLLEYYENIWDILEAFKETADSLGETNQTLATNKLNQITKMISIISTIALPAMLTSFIFAVDVPGIPFGDHPYGFWLVLIVMFMASLTMLGILKYKKWF